MTPHFPAAHPVQGSSAFAVAVLWVGFVLALTGVADGQNGNRTLEPTDGEANARLVERGVGTPTDREVTVLDRIWELPKLYRNDNGPIIQEISLIGRYHGQLWGVDSSQGSINEWEDRRMRAGARIRLLDGFTIASNFELDAKENASTAEYIDTLTLGWTHAEKFQVLVGQQKPGFTYEYSISSNRILTIERSLLVNQLVPDKAPGVMVEQVLGKFHYQLGAYSGQPIDDRLSNPFGLVALEYDLSEWSERDQMAV